LIWPYDARRGLVEKLMPALLAPPPLLVAFDVDGERYLWCPTWDDQQINRPSAERVLPGWERLETTPDTYPGAIVHRTDGTLTEPSVSRPGAVTAEGKRREGKRREGSQDPEVDEVWQHYLKWHPRAVADKPKPGKRYGSRLGCIADRLEEGFTVDRLKAAIDGNHYSSFHNGKNERRKPYHDITLICRDAQHVEMFELIEDPAEVKRREAEAEAIRQHAVHVRLRLVPPEPGKTIDDYPDLEELPPP
jgi:hypothetical protein